MPIYEYACRACGHEFEALQKISDAPLTDCPVCNEVALHKKVSAAAFRLAGGGWYETDFKSDGKRNLARSTDEKKSDSKSESGKSDGAVKTDTKSASGDSAPKAKPAESKPAATPSKAKAAS